MSETYIDHEDIQGNIVKGYGRYGYPKARYVFFNFSGGPEVSQSFLKKLLPLLTSGTPWDRPDVPFPPATTNIALSYEGLKNLGLPEESLHSFPDEFSLGMKARANILGDDGVSEPENWDPIWHDDKAVHMFLSINARDTASLEARYNEIQSMLNEFSGGIKQLFGHRGPNGEEFGYQDASAVYVNGKPSPMEHFGYVDGISDPYFKGSGSNPNRVLGGGKPTRMNPATLEGWEPLETGEFILGYRDEAKEIPEAPVPRLLSFNGTFMVYRKLHQNVGTFNEYIEEVGKDFPGGKNTLSAKLVGRWKNGAPLTTFPTEEEADQFAADLAAAREKRDAATTDAEREKAQEYYLSLQKKLTAFNYNEDIPGSKCPMGAHLRRANPRGALEYGVTGAYDTPGALVDRRRILRRGLPYGEVKDPTSNDGEHGIIFMSINASIKRQFEFVQQQWINYGNDFKLANEKDPILGNHGEKSHMMIQGDKKTPPFFCANLPRFVETRGGEYFFIPSISAIRMMSKGLIDPT